jgi:RND family efflux transporter MFP subunit
MRRQSPVPTAQTPQVVVGRPVVKEVTDYEDLPGRVEAVASVDVRARVTGYLDKVLFKEGEEVKQGQPMFEIDPRTYQADFKRAEGTLAQAKAHLDRLQLDYKRAAPLLPSQAISREDYDKIVGDRAESEAAVTMAEAARESARLNLEFTKVTAPISGRASKQMIDPGNMVKADETVLTSIVSLDPIYIYFDPDERTMLRVRRLIRAGKVKSAREAAVPVLAGLVDEVDDAGKQLYTHTGRINFVDNRLEATTGTLRLRGVFDNPDRIFSPGMFARIRIPIGSPHKAILISEQALVRDQGQIYVYVVDDKKRAEYRHVKVGLLQDGLRVVEEGLAENEQVILSGLQRVRPGIDVEPKAAEAPHVAESPAQTAGSPSVRSGSASGRSSPESARQ